MSGGCLNYVYGKVEETAHRIEARSNKASHRAFAKHLLKVSEALHDIEWVFNGDYVAGEEEEAINNVITPQDEMTEIKENAEQIIKEMQNLLKRIEGINEKT